MVVLIPAYEPDYRLIDLVRELGHHRVVVVDDGSGRSFAQMFARVKAIGAHVITLDRNYGKGFALKTGFAYVRSRFPGEHVVCADSDGQHRAEDIDAVAGRLATTSAAMVLGSRRFTGPVPARSRYGNALTRKAYRMATGLDLLDTQTGLRGYPARMLTWLGEVSGDRFEYELRLLLRAAQEKMPMEQVEIATIYLENNASSHFRPVRDSLRIYGQLLSFTASSFLGFLVDAAILFILTALTGNLVLSAIGARLVSATVNYNVNSAVVFGARRSTRAAPVKTARSLWRYAALATGILVANVLVLQWLTSAIGSVVVAKVLTELILFAASFLIQKYLVFARR